MMIRRLCNVLILAVVTALASATVARTEIGCGCCCDKPYGGYRASPRWGWYGARQNVTSVKEAREYLEEFYDSSLIRIGTIKERDGYFEAEISRKSNAKRERVIIDKGCGRIRTIE